MLCCPVCGNGLTLQSKAARCPKGHAFDRAKEGYFNLLRTQKSGDRMGDDKASARARRDFLNKGYYALLKDELVARFANQSGALLDICCGEGYYTAALAQNPHLQVYGFDLSKEMVRLAAKRGGGTYFVANLARIPVQEASFDFATHLFAPFNEKEFARVLKPGGSLFTVMPGAQHLWGLKQVLYDRPYLNEEQLPQTQLLQLKKTCKITKLITLQSAADIDAVFKMTPYYYRTGAKDKAKLQGLESLKTPIEFVIAEYQKP